MSDGICNFTGHTNPELTLCVYAHALREEETDLSFLDFDSTKRHPRGTEHLEVAENQNAPDLSGRGHSVFMEHETRFEFIGSTASATASPAAPTNHSLIARDSPSRWEIIPGIAHPSVSVYLLLILGPVLLGTDAR